MNHAHVVSSLGRLVLSIFLLGHALPAGAQVDPLPSWNNGAAKEAILSFVKQTTDKTSPSYVPPEDRVAAFDQDGTLWVEHPVYAQIAYCLQRVAVLARTKPELKTTEPFKTVLSGDPRALEKLSRQDIEKILAATLSGMSVEQFNAEVKNWLDTAKDSRWRRPYTELIYLPMLEVLQYMRANGYTTYIVTGGGQDFVRVYARHVYDIPPEHVVGTAGDVTYGYDKEGKPVLTKSARLLLNDDGAGKAQGIHFMIGRRPLAAFGNSVGDRQMLEYTKGGAGTRLAMLVMHDDRTREYAYGPANGLPDTRIGTFTQKLYDEANQKGWIVISMKNDWRFVFTWEKQEAAAAGRSGSVSGSATAGSESRVGP